MYRYMEVNILQTKSCSPILYIKIWMIILNLRHQMKALRLPNPKMTLRLIFKKELVKTFPLVLTLEKTFFLSLQKTESRENLLMSYSHEISFLERDREGDAGCRKSRELGETLD